MLRKLIKKHNEKILLKNGFIHCACCREVIANTDKYCQYCGEKVVEKIKPYEIYVDEKKYINTEDSEVTVSFQMYGRDWCKLSRSSYWEALEGFLHQRGSKDNRKFHREKQD